MKSVSKKMKKRGNQKSPDIHRGFFKGTIFQKFYVCFSTIFTTWSIETLDLMR